MGINTYKHRAHDYDAIPGRYGIVVRDGRNLIIDRTCNLPVVGFEHFVPIVLCNYLNRFAYFDEFREMEIVVWARMLGIRNKDEFVSKITSRFNIHPSNVDRLFNLVLGAQQSSSQEENNSN